MYYINKSSFEIQKFVQIEAIYLHIKSIRKFDLCGPLPPIYCLCLHLYCASVFVWVYFFGTAFVREHSYRYRYRRR